MHTRVSRVRNGLALAVMLIVMAIVILTHEMANQHDMNYYYIFIPLWMSLLLSSHHSFTSRGNKLFSIRHAHSNILRIGDTILYSTQTSFFWVCDKYDITTKNHFTYESSPL